MLHLFTSLTRLLIVLRDGGLDPDALDRGLFCLDTTQANLLDSRGPAGEDLVERIFRGDKKNGIVAHGRIVAALDAAYKQHRRLLYPDGCVGFTATLIADMFARNGFPGFHAAGEMVRVDDILNWVRSSRLPLETRTVVWSQEIETGPTREEYCKAVLYERFPRTPVNFLVQGLSVIKPVLITVFTSPGCADLSGQFIFNGRIEGGEVSPRYVEVCYDFKTRKGTIVPDLKCE